MRAHFSIDVVEGHALRALLFRKLVPEARAARLAREHVDERAIDDVVGGVEQLVLVARTQMSAHLALDDVERHAVARFVRRELLPKAAGAGGAPEQLLEEPLDERVRRGARRL